MADQTVSTLVVDAPPDRVMAVIADIKAYPDWNDEMKEVEVLSVHEDGGGRPARVRFVLDAGAIHDTYTLDYVWQGDTSVSWTMVEEAQMMRRLDGSYELEPAGDATKVTYRLTADVKVPMIGLMKRKVEKVIVDRALKGLKKRVER